MWRVSSTSPMHDPPVELDTGGLRDTGLLVPKHVCNVVEIELDGRPRDGNSLVPCNWEH